MSMFWETILCHITELRAAVVTSSTTSTTLSTRPLTVAASQTRSRAKRLHQCKQQPTIGPHRRRNSCTTIRLASDAFLFSLATERGMAEYMT